MKILTYNLWDSPAGMPEREAHIRDTLTACDADILCLQEVSDANRLDTLSKACGCPCICFHPVSGTAVLTKEPQKASWLHDCAAAVTVSYGVVCVQIVSLHLPWNSAKGREEAITEIVRRAGKTTADYTFLAGDFNCADTSDIHRYLTGDCTIRGEEAYFYDLALSHQAASGKPTENTLDFQHNPRWGVYEPVNTIEPPRRYDRIYLQNPYPAPLPFLKGFGLFGMNAHPATGLCPSDHYGVCTELALPGNHT